MWYHTTHKIQLVFLVLHLSTVFSTDTHSSNPHSASPTQLANIIIGGDGSWMLWDASFPLHSIHPSRLAVSQCAHLSFSFWMELTITTLSNLRSNGENLTAIAQCQPLHFHSTLGVGLRIVQVAIRNRKLSRILIMFYEFRPFYQCGMELIFEQNCSDGSSSIDWLSLWKLDLGISQKKKRMKPNRY